MRLTKSDKDAFVRAVMDDVPEIDYGEQVRSLMNKWGFEALPADLRAMVEKYPEYFEAYYVYTPSGCPSISVYCPPEWKYSGFKEHEPEKFEQLRQIGELSEKQSQERGLLEVKVRGLIESCTTLKAAEARLPEFKKYLPAERDATGTINLPVANTLADLITAGWPKGEQHAAA